MSNWTIHWHYLAGPVCALSNSKWMDVLIKNLSDDRKKEILNCVQTIEADGYPPFINELRRIGKYQQGKADPASQLHGFCWDEKWPSGLKLVFACFSKLHYGDFILTANTLYIRYDQCPPLPAVDLQDSIYSEAFMKAIDELVTTQEWTSILLKGKTAR